MSILPGFISQDERDKFDLEKFVNKLPWFVCPPKEGRIAVKLLQNNVLYETLYIRPISYDVNFVYTSKGEFNIVSSREMRSFLESVNKQMPLEAPVEFLMQFFPNSDQ